MNKKWVYGILLMAQCFVLNAQMLYTHQSSVNSNFLSVTQEQGTNNYLLVNLNVSYSPHFEVNKSQILKISENGVLLDSLNLPPNLFFVGPLLYHKNYYYIYATQIKHYGPGSESYFTTVYKIDQNLQVVKTAIMDTTYNDFLEDTKIVAKNNSLYLGHAQPASSRIHFYKTDLNLVKKDSAVQDGLYLNDIANYGNKLLASGVQFAQGSATNRNQVMELDTNFNVLSRFNLDSLTSVSPGCSQTIGISLFTTNLHAISDDKYSVMGHSRIVYNMNCDNWYGNVSSVIKDNKKVLNTSLIGSTVEHLYTQPYTSSSSKRHHHIYSCAQAGWNAESAPGISPSRILIHKVDTGANLVWVKYYGEQDMYYRPSGVHATVDSGVVVCGMRYNLLNPAVPGACEGFVMKLDKDGNQQFVGINAHGTAANKQHRCYPNPAGTAVFFDLPLQHEVDLIIMDALGKELKKIPQYNKQSKVDVSELPEGIYFYKAIGKTAVCSGKFVKG
jgi:hypothetical protein